MVGQIYYLKVLKIELAEYEEKLKKEKADGEVPTKDESTPGEGARDRVAIRNSDPSQLKPCCNGPSDQAFLVCPARRACELWNK